MIVTVVFALTVGAFWGYFRSPDVELTGESLGYQCYGYDTPAVETLFCKICGATTHWMLTDQYKANTDDKDRMGINMKLFDSDHVTGVELQFPDGKSWCKGNFGYSRETVIINDTQGF